MWVHWLLVLALAVTPHSGVGSNNGTGSINGPGATDDLSLSRAIQQVEQLGGQIHRDASAPGRPVTLVCFHARSAFDDADLALLRPFSKLTTLDLRETRVCGTRILGGGFKELGHFGSLTTLYVDHTPITNTVVKELCKLRHLTTLDLSGTKITDAGIKDLAEIKSLTTLNLNETRVTDTGLMELRNLSNLRWLYIYRTKVTDEGRKRLRALLPNLRI